VEKALNTAFQYNGPVLIHVATVKGKGYRPAEEHPENYHGISSFDLATGNPKKFNGGKTWTAAFGEKITAMAQTDERIVAVTAAMTDGTGLGEFSKRFPERFFDVGIAEEHAMTFAAGLAAAGARPYVAIYSSFLQRAYDQLIHDVAQQNLPVRICIDRAGLVGQDGPTHHGAFDISFLRAVPGLAVFLPKDLYELDRMMELSLDYNGPVAIRYPRGAAVNFDLPDSMVILGQPEIIERGDSIAIISAGHIFSEAFKFHKMLKNKGINAGLINLRFISPLDKKALLEEICGKKTVFTFEDNVKTAGIGEMIACLLKQAGSDARMHSLCIPDSFVTHGSISELRELCGLTAENAMKIFES
jgi:1-deoxy-D-xylulose-5-phosphate synthase